MKTILKLLALLTATTATAFGYSFGQAVSSGYISFTAKSSSGYSETVIQVSNLTTASVDVDFSTVVFVQANDSQRVGLARELSTGGYHLRLAARSTYTLRFSSRCMDKTRSSPTANVYYGGWLTIPSQFQSIITALRNNSTQSAVWTLTENSGTLSQAWKAADPRNTQTPPPANTTPSFDLSGTLTYQISGSSVTIKAGRVTNNGNYTSGTLRLRLYALRSPYTGGTLSTYHTLGASTLGNLAAHSYWSNLAPRVAFNRPSTGSYYIMMSLEESTAAGWKIRDWACSSTTTRF